ncbi:MAG: sugar ABC transporter permease [Pseudomonadota bacterium]
MKHKTFFWFMLPSAFAMLLFIALPIMSVMVQSLYIEHEKVLIEVENCVPLSGCTTETVVDTEAEARLKAERPLGQFNGLGTYINRNHLATSEIAQFWSERDSLGDFAKRVYGLPFYKALAFTLTYTFLVTPMVIILGFCIALAVNALPRMFRGLAIFFSLLPMMVTPLIGSLILYWMIDSRGVLGQTLQVIMNDPDLSLRASPVLTWIMLMVYGTWSSAPFAFVVFYAGLQTVPEDTLESAMIDGASRWERVRYVVVPYLMPLVTFIALIQLMDNFRVFEPIVGFSAEASATSLSWIIYNDLRGEVQLFGSAAATSMLTIAGVAVLLAPVLVRTWRDFKGSKA